MKLIHGARIASAGEWNGEHRDILIDGDRILDIVLPGSATLDAERIDASGMLVIPGLVNAHTHSHGNLARGVADRLPLESFLAWAPWSMGHTPEHARIAALLGAAEMVRKGCTAAYDLFAAYPPTPEGIDAVADAYAEIGMRAVVAPLMADMSLYEAMPGLLDCLPADLRGEVTAVRPAPWSTNVQVCRDAARRWSRSSDLCKLALGPTIAHHCSDDFLRALGALAREFDLGLHMHISESKPDAIASTTRYGKSALAHLQDLGLLGPRFVAAHAVWIDDEDVARLADSGAGVAHNPGSNMKLGSGIAETRRMLDRGVTLGTGTDGARSSDNQNLFEVMRLASFASRVVGADESAWLSAQDAFAAATSGGARLLGWEGQIGVIRKGAKADLVFLDIAQGLHYMPLNDAIAQTVFCEDGTAVDTVMIGGRLVLRGGVFTSIDLKALARRADAALEDMLWLNAGIKARVERLEPHVAAYAQNLRALPHPLNRFSGDGPRARTN